MPPKSDRALFALNDSELHALVAPEQEWLIGVSGGVDSMVLLEFLAAKGYQRLVLCHLDHRLRGEDSAADAQFVETAAARLGLPFEGGAVDVAALAGQEKRSLEAAGRHARHALFAEVARRRGCPRLLLAHHLDDALETVLMNFFRGGRPNLPAATRTIRMDGVPIEVVRPLHETARADIEAWAVEHGVAYREDASNSDRAHLRNRIRHDLVPELDRLFGRETGPIVLRTARLLADENAFLERTLERCVLGGGHAGSLSVAALSGLDLVLRRRAVKRWLSDDCDVPDVGSEEVERVLGLLDVEDGPAKVNLPGDRHARRRAGELFVE